MAELIVFGISVIIGWFVVNKAFEKKRQNCENG